MPAHYYVTFPALRSAEPYGPYSLASAKAFARIGSQTGGPREVWRAGGGLVRRYEHGQRVFPADGVELEGLTRREVPRELRRHGGRARPNPSTPKRRLALPGTRTVCSTWRTNMPRYAKITKAKAPASGKAALLHKIDHDPFLGAYFEAALWSSSDSSGRPLDKRYSVSDFTADALRTLIGKAERFYSMPGVEQAIGDDFDDQVGAGHDLWLTQNRHGAGFWDGDWQEPEATLLTEAAHAVGECSIGVSGGRLVTSCGNPSPKQRHCVVELDAAGNTVAIRKFKDGRTWTEDWSEAMRLSGELSSRYPRKPGFEVVTEEMFSNPSRKGARANPEAPSASNIRKHLPWLAETRLGAAEAAKRIRAAIVEAGNDDTKAYDALKRMDATAETHGVEYIASHQDTAHTPKGLSYLNTGDPYIPTVIFDHGRRCWCLTAWGNIVERNAKRFGE